MKKRPPGAATTWTWSTLHTRLLAAAIALAVATVCPCLVAVAVSPSGGHVDAADFGVATDEGLVRVYVGTPPRAADLRVVDGADRPPAVVDGRRCGLTIHASPEDSASATFPAGRWSGEGECAVGMDVVVVGGRRFVVPVRFRRDAHGGSAGSPVYGVLGLCPGLAESWGLSPTYVFRCSGVCMGAACRSRISGCPDREPLIDAYEDRDAAHVWHTDAHGGNGTETLRASLSFIPGSSPWPPGAWPHTAVIGVPPLGVRLDGRRANDTFNVGPDGCGRLAAVGTGRRSGELLRCLPCTRGRVFVTLFAATALIASYMWRSITEGGREEGDGTDPARRRAARDVAAVRTIVQVAANISALACYAYAATADHGRPGTPLSGAVPHAAFAFLTVVPVVVGWLSRLGETSAGCDAAAAVEDDFVLLPLYAAFWLATDSEDNHFARTLLGIGAALICSTSATTTAAVVVRDWALGRGTRYLGSFVALALASVATTASFVFAFLPVVAAFLGDGLAIRLLCVSFVCSVCGMTAVSLAGSGKHN
jgi:hypothetical protein